MEGWRVKRAVLSVMGQFFRIRPIADVRPFRHGERRKLAREVMVAKEPIAPPVWLEEHLRLAVEAACVALWSWQVDTDDLVMDRQGYSLWDVTRSEHLTFERLSENQLEHPSEIVVGVIRNRQKPAAASFGGKPHVST